MSNPITPEAAKSPQTTDSQAVGCRDLVRLLGSALCDAVDHLDYTGWGDEWEREGRENIEPAIREAINQYQALFPDEKTKPSETIWKCGQCGRAFRSRTSRRQHTMHSERCKPNDALCREAGQKDER